MNVGFPKYVDTRIAVNLFHILPAAERATLRTRLLGDATQVNPFNPGPWYLLAEQAPSPKAASQYENYENKHAK